MAGAKESHWGEHPRKVSPARLANCTKMLYNEWHQPRIEVMPLGWRGRVRSAMRQTRSQRLRSALYWLAVMACVLSLLGSRAVPFLRLVTRPNSAPLHTKLPSVPAPVNESEEEEEQRTSDGWRHQHKGIHSSDRIRRDHPRASQCRKHLPARSSSAALRYLLSCVRPMSLAWPDPFCNGLGAPYLC